MSNKTIFFFLSCFCLLLLMNCTSTVFFKVSKDDPESEMAILSVGGFINVVSIDGEILNIKADTALGMPNEIYLNDGTHILEVYYNDSRYSSGVSSVPIVVEKGKEYRLATKYHGTFGNWTIEYILNEIKSDLTEK